MSKASIAQSSYVPCFHSASRSGVICSNSFCANAAGGRPSASTTCTSQKPCSSSLALCSKPSTMTFTLLPPASLLSDACNGWCMSDEVQDELEREQPLLGVRPWRLQFGGELRHLVDHAGQLVTDRSWPIWRQGLAAVARLGHVRVVD